MRFLTLCVLVGCGSEKITAEPFRAPPPDAAADTAMVDPPGVDSGPTERAIIVTVVYCVDGGGLDVPGKLALDLVGTVVCAHHVDGTIEGPRPLSLSDGHIASSCTAPAISPVDYLIFAVPR